MSCRICSGVEWWWGVWEWSGASGVGHSGVVWPGLGPWLASPWPLALAAPARRLGAGAKLDRICKSRTARGNRSRTGEERRKKRHQHSTAVLFCCCCWFRSFRSFAPHPPRPPAPGTLLFKNFNNFGGFSHADAVIRRRPSFSTHLHSAIRR